MEKLSQFSPSTSLPPPLTSSSSRDSIVDILQLDMNASVFAQELTRIELEYLCFLGPEELVNAFARESSNHQDFGSVFGWEQCDQMAELFFKFFPFLTVKIRPIALKNVHIWFSVLANNKYTLKQLPKVFKISPNLVTLVGKL